jgi:hypothetical protein
MTIAVQPYGSFRKIRLRQTSPNHTGGNDLLLCAFELFGAIIGLQQNSQACLAGRAETHVTRAGDCHAASGTSSNTKPVCEKIIRISAHQHEFEADETDSSLMLMI